MAGKRQHFLPRFLLTGFACRKSKKGSVVYVCEKDRPPSERNINNVAVEGHFYGRDPQVDEAITRREGRYGALLNAVRDTDHLPAGSADLVVEFVVNLAVRTRFIRATLLDLGCAMSGEFRGMFTDPARFRLLLWNLLQCEPDRLLRPLLKGMGVARLRDLPNPKRIALLRTVKGWLDESASDWVGQVNLAFDEVDATVLNEEEIKAIVLRALARDVSPGKGRQVFRGFGWSVEVHPKGTFVLGDLGPMRCSDGEFFPLVPGGQQEESVVLLVSDRHLLVGSRGLLPASIEPDDINRASVQLSHSFFVSSQDTAREAAWSAEVGVRSDAAWAKALEEFKQKVAETGRL